MFVRVISTSIDQGSGKHFYDSGAITGNAEDKGIMGFQQHKEIISLTGTQQRRSRRLILTYNKVLISRN